MVKAAHEDYGQAQDIARGRESRERGREIGMAVSSAFLQSNVRVEGYA